MKEESNSLYHVITKAEFGKYDFKKKAFVFQPLQANTYFRLKRSNRYGCKQCETHTQIDLFFNNTSDFQYMPMNKDFAKALIDMRKNNSGTIDRGVQIKIVFNISEGKKLEKNNDVVEASLYGDIKEIEVIDTPKYRKGTNKTLLRLIPE